MSLRADGWAVGARRRLAPTEVPLLMSLRASG
jgi:hypothetical protein